MKKILFIIPSLEIGGTLSSFISLYNQLCVKYDIHIFALSHDGLQDIPFASSLLPKDKLIHAYRCKLSNTSGLYKYFVAGIKIACRVLRVLKIKESCIYNFAIRKLNNKYDVVIGFQEELPNEFASKILSKKKIAWIHCDYSRHPACGKELNIYKKFDKIVCVSKYTAEVFKEYYPELSDRIGYIYNILDKQKILNKSVDKNLDSRFLKDNFTIISVGRITKVKRFEFIPKIANFLKQKGLNFQWYIIGPNIGDTCFYELQNNIKLFQVDDCVIYLGGKSNPYPYFKNSNLLVSLSMSEACPMIFNEAKILGIPSISTDFPTASEFIKDGFDGKICTLEQMGEVIFNVMKNDEYYRYLLFNVQNQLYSNDEILLRLDTLLQLR